MSEKKLHGRLIAIGQVKWMKYGEKESQVGFIFAQHNGFDLKVDKQFMKQYSLSMDAMLDCVKQLDEKGEDIKADYTPKTGWKNAGMVLTSRKDPRICCSVILSDGKLSYQKFDPIDLELEWFFDIDNDQGNMTLAEPERAAQSAELAKAEESVDMFGLPSFLSEGKFKEIAVEAMLGIDEEEEGHDEPEDEPDDDDMFFQDAGHLGGQTKVMCMRKTIGTFTEHEDAVKAAKAWMKKNNYYPNVWQVSDHGNYHKMSL